MGVLRWQMKLDTAVERAGQKSVAKFDLEVKLALRLGAYQILFLSRIPARAAVNESVELVKLHGKRSAAPLVNAVLRKVSAQSNEIALVPDNAVKVSNYFSHPLWIVERWIRTYGLEITRRICEYDQQRPGTTLRVVLPKTCNEAQTPSSHGSSSTAEHGCNTLSRADSVLEELAREDIELQAASIVGAAWHVVRGDVTRTAAYRERRIAIQDEASQLVALLAQGNSILDCCASPGGKSAVAAERNPRSLIVAMDLHLHRVRLMHELTGSRIALVADARHLPFGKTFDCVIADLPCTGTGTLSRNPEIKWRLSADDPSRLAQLQLDILRSVAQRAKEIVYSTCSLEPEEGEHVVDEFLTSHRNFQKVPVATRLEQLANENAINPQPIQSLIQADFLRTIPGIHGCDGFFAAILTAT
jgi:16S rRNA (cytosine967-C5)-methyltransferase